MTLPKWIEGLKESPVSLLPSDSDKLINALEIAWEALDDIRKNTGNHSECPITFCAERASKDTLRRIADLGGESETTIEELGEK